MPFVSHSSGRPSPSLSDITLPNANPQHKDIYLQIDWMETADHTHRPSQAAIDMIVAAFANAEITLHVEMGKPVAHQDVLNFDGAGGAALLQAISILSEH